MKVSPALYLGISLACALTVGWGIGRLRAASNPPRIHIAAPTWDFGIVSGEQPESHVFEIENTGGQPLVISKLEKSCGCVQTAELKDSVILPGGKLPLKVTIEVTPNDQDTFEQVKLYGIKSDEPISVVNIKGRVRPIVNIVPPIVNFGVLTQDDLNQTQQLTISKRGAESERDHAGVILPNNNWHSNISRQGAKQWNVSLSLAPDTPIGPLDGSIEIKPTWGQSRKVLVLGELLGPVSANPKEVYQSLSESQKGSVAVKFGGDEKATSIKVLSLTPTMGRWINSQVQGKDTIIFHYDASGLKVAQRQSGRCLAEVSTVSGKSYRVSVPITFVR